MIYQNILETIGNTPLVRLNWMSKICGTNIYGKIETFNPGHSIKDRMALKMLEDAEAEGKIQPGGTIIECTSGNTGMGLAIAAAVKGYKCIFTTTDKQAKTKIDMLKALGADVIICPTNVEPDDPRSYYKRAEALNEKIENSFWCNQYDNPSNAIAHYESTGPEIWEQSEGKISHLIVGVGTGGTISGTARYLKEQNPNIKVLGVDTYGSVFKKYHETGEFDEKEIYPYITEGIGEDILPKNVDFSLIDHFEKVTDKDGALATRDLARKEGILLGYSAGSAVAATFQMKDRFDPDDFIVIIFHDHGSRYIEKIFNDDWMMERGFLEPPKTVGDIVSQKDEKKFVSVDIQDSIEEVVNIMKDLNISQLPVEENSTIIGSITESNIIDYMLNAGGQNGSSEIRSIVSKPFPIIDWDSDWTEIGQYITRQNPAVITKDPIGDLHIITQYDLLQAI